MGYQIVCPDTGWKSNTYPTDEAASRAFQRLDEAARKDERMCQHNHEIREIA